VSHKNTLFREILQFVPKHEFQNIVNEHNLDKGVRQLTTWTQFVALLFGQITGHYSVRSLTAAFNTQEKYFNHLGVTSVKRATLCDANEQRNPIILEKVYFKLLSRTQQHAPKHGFRFSGKVLAMDATIINLCLSLCPWAQFHHNKGAFKLHTAIDLAGNLPTFMTMTSGKTHEIKIARGHHFEKGTTVVADRGYNDFGWLAKLTEQGVYFVIREKDNTQSKVRATRPKLRSKGVCADQDIRLAGISGQKYPQLLRRVSYRDPETGDYYVFLTNRFDLAAITICALYKSRWEVELFFKTLKGQLQVEKFVGTSVNAVLWQIWVALIAYLLIMLIKYQNNVSWSIPCIVGALAIALFQKTDPASLFSPYISRKLIGISPGQLALIKI